jgi:hypothetical protein
MRRRTRTRGPPPLGGSDELGIRPETLINWPGRRKIDGDVSGRHHREDVSHPPALEQQTPGGAGRRDPAPVPSVRAYARSGHYRR